MEDDLPREVKYLESYDRFVGKIQTLFDMPNSRLDLLWRFLQQNNGKFSKRARENEFGALTDEEAVATERMFHEAIGSP